MAAVDFYQLEQSPLERVLPRLAQRVLEKGDRLLVVSSDDRQLEQLDEQLWTYEAASFLPHGRATGTADETQPILLATTAEPVNAAPVVALVDGLWREDALRFDRALHLFDESHLGDARQAWRSLSAAGVQRNFWRQIDGRWTRQA